MPRRDRGTSLASALPLIHVVKGLMSAVHIRVQEENLFTEWKEENKRMLVVKRMVV